MNIFEELAESYTYNGVVSLKALNDDIVTLENQIDSYSSTLKELQLRGKKSATLVQKMRDAKIRLSLLKAVYKRESDRNTSDDIILNMLGISANNAKEVESPETAADGKEPHVQDFEESEVEIVEETVEDTEAVENENEVLDEVVIDVVDEDEEHSANDYAQEEAVKDTEACSIGHKIEINTETGEVILNDTAFMNPTEYHIPSREDVSEVDNVTYPGEPTDNLATAISIDEAIKILSDSHDNQDFKTVVEEEYDEHECPPPPTIDDYCEPVDVQTCEPLYFGDETPTEVSTLEQVKEQDNLVSDGITGIDVLSDGTVVENESSLKNGVTFCDYPAYEAFSDNVVEEIYSSFDLSPYTDMVNTQSVVGVFDDRKKRLEITFFNVNDYSVFVKLLKNKKPNFLSFLEKGKSIFMDVHERHGDEEKVYHYEFVGCKLKSLFDTRYAPKSETVTTETVSHECTALFKYKKLKIN